MSCDLCKKPFNEGDVISFVCEDCEASAKLWKAEIGIRDSEITRLKDDNAALRKRVEELEK